MSTTRAVLKSYFQQGDKPTEQQFAELIDSFIHQDDDLSTFIGQFSEVSEAQQGLIQDKYMSPFLTFEAIKSLTRLVNIPDLNSEVQTVVNNAINNLLSFDDADSVINTVKDVIDAFNAMPEGQTLVQLLQGKSDVGHTHTFNQITDMNLPNAKSDSFNLDDSNVLATSKAVRDLYNTRSSSYTFGSANVLSTSKAVADLFDTRRNDTNLNSTTNLATSKAVRDARNQCSIVYNLGPRVEANFFDIPGVGKTGDIGWSEFSNNAYGAIYIKCGNRYWFKLNETRTDEF